MALKKTFLFKKNIFFLLCITIFVTSVQVIKLVVAFQVILCPNKHLFQFSVFCENPTLCCRQFAILPPSGSYDPELPSTTRWHWVVAFIQLDGIYSAFQPPFPVRSHALCTSVTHSLHLYNNDQSPFGIVPPFPNSCSRASVSMLWAAICLGVVGSALTFLNVGHIWVILGAVNILLL